MFLLLAWWILLLAVAVPTGSLCLHCLGAGDFLSRPEDRFLTQAWTGLFVLSAALLLVSFAAPLRPPASVLTLVVLAAGPWLFPGVRRELRLARLPRGARNALLAVLLATSFNAGGPTMLYDTGLYHYPLLRWLADFGTVPGMALLHFRFGFSSSWLATAAVADFGPWQGHTGGVTGGLLLALLVFQFLLALQRFAGRAANVADRFLVCAFPLFFVHLLVQHYQVSPSPNLAAGAGVLVTGWLLLQARRGEPSGWNAALLLAAGAVSAKLVAVPALGIALLGRAAVRDRPRSWLLPVLAAILLVAPMIYANFVSTGCPLFPAAVGCVENPAAIGSQAAAREEKEVHTWARYGGFAPRGATFASVDWLWPWLLRSGNCVFPIALIAGIAVWVRKPNLRWPAALGLSGTLYVFLAAPDQRFGIGYLVTSLGLAGAAVSEHRFSWLGRFPRTFWLSAAIVVLLSDAMFHELGYYYFLGVKEAAPSLTRVLAPPHIRIPPSIEHHIDGIVYRSPRARPTDQCWAISQPCTPYSVNPSLHLCSPAAGIRGGLCRGTGP